jgi:MATE family multidrug resistance protein
MWIEWWIYEIMALIAGALGVKVLAAHVVCVNVETIIYMVALGFQQSTSVLVGNSLGAGRPRKAIHYGKICVGVTMILNVWIGIAIYRWKDIIANIYTSDENVLILLEPAMKLIAFFQFIDGLNCVLEGVLRGLRLQEKAVTAKASVMTFIQLPLAYYLGQHIGLIGIWIAASVGFGISCVIYATIILRADFTKCSLDAMKEGVADDDRLLPLNTSM